MKNRTLFDTGHIVNTSVSGPPNFILPLRYIDLQQTNKKRKRGRDMGKREKERGVWKMVINKTLSLSCSFRCSQSLPKNRDHFLLDLHWKVHSTKS